MASDYHSKKPSAYYSKKPSAYYSKKPSAYYSKLFQPPSTPSRVISLAGFSYPEAEKSLAAKFDFKILNDCFEAVVVSANAVQPSPFDSPTDVYVLYTYDNLTYRSTMKREKYIKPGGIVEDCFNIRLYNDRFLYPHESDLSVFKPPGFRHKSFEWSLLDGTEHNKLPSLVKFCQTRLSNPQLPREMQFADAQLPRERQFADAQCHMFYSFKDYAVDFKGIFKNGKQWTSVSISFHHGFPENPFDDVWFD